MRQLTLDSSNVAELLFPGADSRLPQAIFRRRDSYVLLRFMRIVQRLRAIEPRSAVIASFIVAFDSLCSRDQQIQARVLSYPSFGFWLDVTEELLRRDAHVRFEDAHFSVHVQDFARFAAAASLLERDGDFECTLRTNAQGLIAFPGTSVFLRGHALGAHEAIECVLVGGRITSLRKVGTEASVEVNLGSVPKVLDGSVELNSIDEDLRLTGRTSYQYEDQNPTQLPRWQSALADAWDLLGKSSAPLAEEILMGTRALVPVTDTGVDTHSSASFSEAPGLIALSWHSDPAILAEALVHEYHHQKLNALQVIDPLISGPPAAEYYSPWRPDPRPLNGILHGAYVFQAVLRWWDQLSPSMVPSLTADRIAARKYILSRQIASAVETLQRYGELTKLGTWLCDALVRFIDAYTRSQSAILIADQTSLERALKRHVDVWRETNKEAWQKLEGENMTSGQTPPPNNDGELLAILGLSAKGTENDVTATFSNDVLLEWITRVDSPSTRQQLRDSLGEFTSAESVLRTSVRGHLAYVDRQFGEAAKFYTAAITKTPTSSQLWQSFAFALRHTGAHADSTAILRHSDLLASESRNLVSSDLTVGELIAKARYAISAHRASDA